MNFVAHIRVAELCKTDDSMTDDDRATFYLGAALPDVAAMGRFRLASQTKSEALRAGVALHHQTDEAFHRHEWFRHHSGSVTTALDQLGLNRGAARACGHVGVELLLDGLLLANTPTLRATASGALAKTTDPGLDIETLVDPAGQNLWRQHLDRVASWPLPDDYRQPNAVAKRLWRILSHRPRLAFDEDELPLVSGALIDQQEQLEAGSADLMVDLKTTLAG